MNDRYRPEQIERKGTRALKTAFFAAALLALALVLLCVALFHIIPPEPAVEWAAGLLRKKTGLLATREAVARSFPFGLEATGVTLGLPGGEPLLHIKTLRARLRPLSLLAGRAVLPVSAAMNGGIADGVVTIRPGSASVRLVLADVGFRELPALSGRVELEGAFGGDVYLAAKEGGCPEGYARLEAGGLKGGMIRLFGMPLPIGGMERAGLAAEMKGCRAEVRGLWIEGDDITMRLRGTVFLVSPLQESRMEMTLEVIPGRRLLGEGGLLRLLEPYRKSANYYEIPVGGTLGSPRVGG